MKEQPTPARRRRKAPRPVPDPTPSPPAGATHEPPCTVPVVGIGASAGGLEALELFLANVPKASGLAFVIVQHLDPTHKDMMVELLQRCTTMAVVQVRDRTRIKPDCVYVIPPNKDMSILHGALHLLPPVARRGLRLPIDYFFRSLADDLHESSIGVILSGMGSDGTLGLRAIKEKTGVVFVQDPTTAKFDGMPRSAIASGLADVIAPVEELPGKIVAYLQHALVVATSGHADHPVVQSALEKIVILLRGQTGHDFSLYKKSMVYRRIERRIGLHQIGGIADYVRFLRENPQEVEMLFRELLIGVTSFFRDPEAWEQLKAEVLPALLAADQPNPALRAWVPACSTGEEAYTLAIIFRETVEELHPARNVTLKVFATDLDQHAIEKAREGLFPENIASDVLASRLDRYFVKQEGGYQVAKNIREMVVFAPQNVIMDPPFTKLDLVCCRNLLIYLSPELQKRLLPLFHYGLNPGGFLFLGSAETVGGFTDLFAPLPGATRLYRRVPSTRVRPPVELPRLTASPQHGVAARPQEPTADLQRLADQLLLQKYAPPSALTNADGDILYISGHTGSLLEPAAGKANWNILAMAREGLRHELTAGFKKALRDDETVVLTNVLVGGDGGSHLVSVTIQPLSRPEALRGTVMIVFNDVVAGPRVKTPGRTRGEAARAAGLELDLDHARQELQSVREEMQTSQEELKSTNEELQSTNEELTTSEEELQSMNEELHTVNQELQTRVDDFTRTSNDIKNLLDSTDIATLFLDQDLRVRRFTSETSRITHLIPGDVGRPITDIASALLYPELAEDAHTVLRTLVRTDRQIPTPDGNWFQARILPYRTMDNMIDGLVITFTDITVSKKLEAELRATEARLRERLLEE